MIGNRFKRSQKTGDIGEGMAEIELRRLGYRCIEKVQTARTQYGKCIKSCSGDFRAVGPGGRSVLVEVKWRDRGHIRPSDLKPHQRAMLAEHHNAGGISLIIHASPAGCRVMFWEEVKEICR